MYSPLDRMLVHRRVTSSSRNLILQRPFQAPSQRPEGHYERKPSFLRTQGTSGCDLLGSSHLATPPSIANTECVIIVFAGGKLQLTYSGLPPVEGCSNGINSKVVFYFECGNHVGQPQFERYVRQGSKVLHLQNQRSEF